MLPYYWAWVINFYEVWYWRGFIAACYTSFFAMYCVVYTILILLVILVTAIVTVHERKILADIQSRRGPSKPGYLGILQPIADAIKLLVKEYITPKRSLDPVFRFIAGLSFIIALFFWNLPSMSFEVPSTLNEWTVLASFIISLLHVFTVLFAGWASKSRYSFLGAIRVAAQLISYDIVIVLVYLNLFVFNKEFSFEIFMENQEKTNCIAFFLPFQFIVFFTALLAETSRHPYDLSEAEAELVAGYSVEYSSIRFAMFFLSEYSTVIFSALVLNTVFFGSSFFSGFFLECILWLFKISILTFIIITLRGILPRYRYDQLMELTWKVIIPIECLLLTYNIFELLVFSN